MILGWFFSENFSLKFENFISFQRPERKFEMMEVGLHTEVLSKDFDEAYLIQIYPAHKRQNGINNICFSLQIQKQETTDY